MDYKQLLGLIDAVDKSTLTKFLYKEGNIELEFDKRYEVSTLKKLDLEVENNKQVTSLAKELNKEDLSEKENFEYIKSPLIGTFYSSPSPEEDEFISIGDKVCKDQVIGIIEVMKMMNEVKCNFDGIVEEILIENNETIEYGQCLVKIRLI